jgi:hypothetical protein
MHLDDDHNALRQLPPEVRHVLALAYTTRARQRVQQRRLMFVVGIVLGVVLGTYGRMVGWW